MTSQLQLINGLKKALARLGAEIEVRETHISWVLLTVDFAWKIKKAVDFGFLDFSTLQKRKHFCEEELRLNRRFAPDIYLEVVSINGSFEQPVIQGPGPAIEYAVKMRRFDETGLLAQLAKNSQLEEKHVDAIADKIAQIHQDAPIAGSDTVWGAADQVHHWLTESVQHIKNLADGTDRYAQISKIEKCCADLYKSIQPVLSSRKTSGFIRECHGDLHLNNMVWVDQKLVPFDCIEFNPALRWIDVMSETAFVMMDLEDRGYPAFAWRFINHYLSNSGDYSGLKVLRYYIVYRALVRAKVVLLQRNEAETPTPKRDQLWQEFCAYLALAERWLEQHRPVLIIMHGLSGSGKSTVAASMAEQYRCIRLRSDIERKRLQGLSANENSHAGLDSGIYSAAATDRTYQRLYELAAMLLGAGYPVIVDATFLQRERRDHFYRLALGHNAPFLIVHCDAPVEVLEARIKTRAQKTIDPSEADLAVLKNQINKQDVIEQDEIFVDVDNNTSPRLPSPILQALQAEPEEMT